MFGQHGAGLVGKEMPKLDQLHRTRQQQGFVVFGLSEEEVSLQRKFAEQVPVSYPLLTLKGELRSIYRDIARYPAIFLIDRRGQLQPPGSRPAFRERRRGRRWSPQVLASVP